MVDSRDVKADAAADKARRKALRPWYKKKRFAIPIGLFLLFVLIAVASGGGDGGGNEAGGNGGGGNEAVQAGDIVKAQIPGEATLDVTGIKATTRFTGVTFRDESIPGNEFTKAPTGKTYMVFSVEILNVGEKDLDLNAAVYRLKLPSGEIVDYLIGSSLADEEFGIGLGTTLTPGAKKAATLSWEVPIPSPGQAYVVLWKPNPFDPKQAQFTYTHQ